MQQEVIREIQLDYGHVLPKYIGFCNQLHGHRARVVAHFIGNIQTSGFQEGMVLDFSICKELMMRSIHNVIDHGFAIWKEDTTVIIVDSETNVSTLDFVIARNDRVLVCDEPPTAEYLSKWAFKVLHVALAKYYLDLGEKEYPVRLVKIDWWETPNNCASFTEKDFVVYLNSIKETKNSIKLDIENEEKDSRP